jgi:hypothetical protein
VTPPRIHITWRNGRTTLDPDTCPSCRRGITAIQAPPEPTPAEQERNLTRILPPQWFTVEPCGHEVALTLTVEDES